MPPSSPTHLLSRQVPSWKGNGLHGDRGDCTGAELWSSSCTGWTADSSEDWAVTWRSWEEKDLCLRVFDSVTCILSFKSLQPDALARDEPLDRNVLHLKEHWARRKTRHSLLQPLSEGGYVVFEVPAHSSVPFCLFDSSLEPNRWTASERKPLGWGKIHRWRERAPHTFIWSTILQYVSEVLRMGAAGITRNLLDETPGCLSFPAHLSAWVYVWLSGLCPHVHPLSHKCEEAYWYSDDGSATASTADF